MTALLVFRNDTAPVMEWAADVERRTNDIATARYEWMTKLYDEHDVPEDQRGAFTAGPYRFSGILWPDSMPLPTGWLRPKDSPQLIRPRLGVKVGKRIDTEMRQFDRPDLGEEMHQRFGMPDRAFAGLSMWSCGFRKEDDGIWVTWGTKDVLPQLGDVESHGWVRVPLVEFIERFGEDAL